MLHIVTYDLNKQDKDYPGLFKAIETHYPDNIKCMKSFWFISTNDSAQDVFNKLSSHIDNNDNIFIMNWGTSWRGLIPTPAVDWVKKHGL